MLHEMHRNFDIKFGGTLTFSFPHPLYIIEAGFRYNYLQKRTEDKMDTDFFLIQRMKNGDDRAIEGFIQKYYPKIFQYCLLHIRDWGEAEYLTQETFLKFFQSFERYQHRGKCSAFLYAIASNNCKDYYRKAKEQYMEEVPEKAEADQDMDTAEIRLDVENAVSRLPEELRETAILFFFQGLKQREIAKLLDIKVSLVKYRVTRAKKLLGEYMNDGFPDRKEES